MFFQNTKRAQLSPKYILWLVGKCSNVEKKILWKKEMLWMVKAPYSMNKVSLQIIVQIDKLITIYSYVTWCNKYQQHLKDCLMKQLVFLHEKMNSWMFSLRNISSNLIFDYHSSFEMISHKSFSCRKNLIFIFQVWKWLPLSFSMLWTSKLHAMIVTWTMLKDTLKTNNNDMQF